MMAEGRSAWMEFQDAWDREGEQPRTAGFDDVLDQVGPEATLEWALVDPNRPWAPFVRPNVRSRIDATLQEGIREASGRAAERQAEAERAADEDDDTVIAAMNDKRAERGQEPLSEAQERGVREQRAKRRDQREAP
jgi:hypothetical protein